MIRGHVEVYSDSNLNEGNLIFSEKNLIVDGMGELISTMMTLSPDASTTQSSSLYDASNYTIHAISFGKAGSEYFYNAHANFGPALYGRDSSSQVWVSATTSSYIPNLYVPKPASPTDNNLVYFGDVTPPTESGNYTFTNVSEKSSGFLNIWDRESLDPVVWNDSSLVGFSGLPSNINELKFRDVRLNKSGMLLLDLDGYVSAFRSNRNENPGPLEFTFNTTSLGGGCLQIYTVKDAGLGNLNSMFYAITSAGNVSSWNSEPPVIDALTATPVTLDYFKNPAPTHPVSAISIAPYAFNGIALYQDGTVSAWNRHPSSASYEPLLDSITTIPSSIQGRVTKIGSTAHYHIAILDDYSVCAWGSPRNTSATELSSLYIYDTGMPSLLPRNIDFAKLIAPNIYTIWVNGGTIINQTGPTRFFGNANNFDSPLTDLYNNPNYLNNVSTISTNRHSSIVLYNNGVVSAFGPGYPLPIGNTPWNTTFRQLFNPIQGQIRRIKINKGASVSLGNDTNANSVVSYINSAGVLSATMLLGYLNTPLSSIKDPPAAITNRVRDWTITNTLTGFAVLTDNTVSSWGWNGVEGFTYIPTGIQGLVSSIVVSDSDRLALLTNGQVSAWSPSGTYAGQRFISYISSVPTSVNQGNTGKATDIGLVSLNSVTNIAQPVNGNRPRAFAIVNSPHVDLVDWGGNNSNVPALDQNIKTRYFTNKALSLVSSPDQQIILVNIKDLDYPDSTVSTVRYPSRYHTSPALSAVDLSSSYVGFPITNTQQTQANRTKILSAVDFDTGERHTLFINSNGHVSSWYPLPSYGLNTGILKYANSNIKNQVWNKIACGPYTNIVMGSNYVTSSWGIDNANYSIPTPNANEPAYHKLVMYNYPYNVGVGLYSTNLRFSIPYFLSATYSFFNNANFKQNVNLIPYIGKTINKVPTEQGLIPIVVSANTSLLEGCYAPSGGQIVSLVSGVSPYTVIASASLSGTFNTLGNMDHRGYVNKTSTGNPASGLVVSSTNSLSSTGEIMCIIKIHKDDCAFTNLFGGITQLGIWGYDIKKNIENGKYPPYSFSRFPEQTGTYVTPNEYKLLAKKVFHDNILKVSDNGANAGLKNHADLTIVWKLYFV